MIRYKDQVFNDYFIDEATGRVFYNNGNEVQYRLHSGYKCIKGCKYISGAPIHIIQMHTKYGYKKEYEVHHIDFNRLNNTITNLQYLTPSEHMKLHMQYKLDNGLMKGNQKGENNNMYGKKYKWINDGINSKFLFEGEELPSGWTYGRLWKQESLDSISQKNTGRLRTAESKKKMSIKRKGIKFTEEHKLHMTKKWKLEHKEK